MTPANTLPPPQRPSLPTRRRQTTSLLPPSPPRRQLPQHSRGPPPSILPIRPSQHQNPPDIHPPSPNLPRYREDTLLLRPRLHQDQLLTMHPPRGAHRVRKQLHHPQPRDRQQNRRQLQRPARDDTRRVRAYPGYATTVQLQGGGGQLVVSLRGRYIPPKRKKGTPAMEGR